ncbi:hypothetical protein LCGC14_1729710 [marine sediment metagenome]|uniref:Uncharacterized protein n=1 Tax=marine sediment metagenome TaxID=412755 RepID=A0A0F9H9Z8_9ZZZZ
MINSTLEEYLHILQEEGFDLVYEEEFVRGDKSDDKLMIHFHPDGILSVSDTYYGRLNSANIHYNVLVKATERHGYTSSGHMIGDKDDNDVWSGNHDTRVDIKHKLQGLRELGTFLNPWIDDRMLVWLSIYTDVPSDIRGSHRYREVFSIKDEKTCERFAKLPEHVQKCCHNILEYCGKT